MAFWLILSLFQYERISACWLIAGLKLTKNSPSRFRERTWYRWMRHGAPRWAIRLVESQIGTLDRFGWKHWEIRQSILYCNDLSYRYHWSPPQLIAPLWGIREPHLVLPGLTDNLSSLETARKARNAAKTPKNKPEPDSPDLSTYAHNIYYVK